MANLIITCINRTGNQEPEQCIRYVGGIYNDHIWKHSVNDVIFHMEMTIHSYRIENGQELVDVVIANHNGCKYIKSRLDTTLPDRLLTLPECSP